MRTFRQFVESLERLYSKGQIGGVVVLMMHKAGKITDEEKSFILHEDR